MIFKIASFQQQQQQKNYEAYKGTRVWSIHRRDFKKLSLRKHNYWTYWTKTLI